MKRARLPDVIRYRHVAVALVAATGLLCAASTAIAQSPAPPTRPLPPAATRTPTPGTAQTPTPSFSFDVVKEIVVPLIGDDGRTHYVTLSQDAEGVVRIRISLFSFSALRYNVVLFRRGDCATSSSWGPADVIASMRLEQGAEGASTLALHFFNTRSISLTPGAPNTVYDADGTWLAIYRPGDSGSGLLAACGALTQALGAPGTGGVVSRDERSPPAGAVVVIGMLAVITGGGALLIGGHRRSKRVA